MTQFTTNIWRKKTQRYDTGSLQTSGERYHRDMTQFTTNI